MPDLLQCLSNHDLGFLRLVAELWGVNASGATTAAFARDLAAVIDREGEAQEVILSLPQSAQDALLELKAHGGKMAWSAFTRKYGFLRSMGPAKRTREKPHLFPISTTERLYYRSLIGREFFRQDDALLEMVYLPADFLDVLPQVPAGGQRPDAYVYPPVDLADLGETSFWSDRVLDDSSTLLAALRANRPLIPEGFAWGSQVYWQGLQTLLQDLSLTDRAGSSPSPAARPFLEMTRGQALNWLVNAWLSTHIFNELRLVPDFSCMGSWLNDPLPARRFLVNKIAALPKGRWVSERDLVESVYQSNPDFLRRGGEYDAWMIVSKAPGNPLLRGLESWQDVEARYVHYLVSGPLHWLGLVELADSISDLGTIYLRKSEWFDLLCNAHEAFALPDENVPVVVSPAGQLQMSNLTPRIARYQLSRFGEWLEISPKRYRYQLTPDSLKRAAGQGLTTRHLVSLLRKYGQPAPVPTLLKAIQRWENEGREVWTEEVVIVRLASAEILQALRESPAGKYLGETLNPSAVIVHPEGIERIQLALARMGYLGDFQGYIQ